MEEDAEAYEPRHLEKTKIGLERRKSLEKGIALLKTNYFHDCRRFVSIVERYNRWGYNNICNLFLGFTPEELKG